MSNPNIPIVNAGLLYVSELVLEFGEAEAFFSVSPGAARDSTNTNDLILQKAVVVSGNIVGPNGVDVAVIVTNALYGVYLIGDSTDYKPTAVILSRADGPGLTLPGGYDLSRRIGYAQTNATASPNTAFDKWFQYGAGQNRVYYYEAAIPIITAVTGPGTPAYTLAPATAPSILPPANGLAILRLSYNANAAGNRVDFLPFGAGSSALTSGTAGPVQFGSTVVHVALDGNVIVPFGYNASLAISQIYFQLGVGDVLSAWVVGFYDSL